MPESLRERKRRQTHEQLETAAVTMAVANGADTVTVDRVCEAAMVSRSTFFNYFASLDRAIYGGPLSFDPSGAARVLHAHPSDLVLATIRILHESVSGPEPAALRPHRVTLFIREAGAVWPVSPTHAESRDRLINILVEWLETRPDHARLPDQPPEHEAELTIALALAVAAEVFPDTGRTDGDLASYTAARARLAAIITEPGAGSAPPARVPRES